MGEDTLARFRSVYLFQGLSDKELQQVLGLAKEIQHPAGRTIVEESGQGYGFHMILDGTAEVTVGGERKGTLGPGSYFGEISLIDGKPRSATVTSVDPLRTLSISSWEFSPLLDGHPTIARKLLVGLCERVRAAEGSHTA